MNKLVIYLLLIFSSVFMIQCTESRTLLFLGSYTSGLPGKGIKVYELNVSSGETELLFEVEDVTNPSFLKITEDGKFLLAISESQLAKPGSISSYAIDETSGELKLISKQSTLGRNPVHISISGGQTSVVVSNYTDPSLSLYKLSKEGILSKPIQHLTFRDSSIVKGRQDEAHIHSSNFSKNGKYIYAHDLGGDKIRAFRFQDTLIDMEVDDVVISPGSGPRHFTFDKGGEYGYLLSELSGRLDVFKYESDNGELQLIDQMQTYGNQQEIYRAADIHMSPLHEIVYVSNRGPKENTIVAFKKSSEGKLEFSQRVETEGDHPRNFAIDPSGSVLVVANQFSNNVVIKKLNQETGHVSSKLNEISLDNASTIQIYQY